MNTLRVLGGVILLMVAAGAQAASVTFGVTGSNDTVTLTDGDVGVWNAGGIADTGNGNGGPGVKDLEAYFNDLVFAGDEVLVRSGPDKTILLEQNASGSGLTVSLPALNCVGCWLFVKDGGNAPYAYLFNLTGLNDAVSLVLTNFWDDGPGEISHLAIYDGPARFDRPGVPGEVPLPASAWLFISALAGLGALRRKRAASH